MFWRNPSAAFFNFLLPLLFLALFGAIFSGSEANLQVIVPGIAGHERDVDDVHRAGHEPHLPARGGRAQAHPRHAAADVGLPRGDRRQRGHQHGDPDRDRHRRSARPSSASTGRPTGSRSSSSSSSACAASPRWASRSRTSSRTSTRRRPTSTPCSCPMIFISGVFYDADDAPRFLRDIAEVLPLKHLIDGLSGAMVTGEGVADHWVALLVLAIWTAGATRARRPRLLLGGAAGLRSGDRRRRSANVNDGWVGERAEVSGRPAERDRTLTWTLLAQRLSRRREPRRARPGCGPPRRSGPAARRRR